MGKAFTLETDASKVGLGAVLSQIQADNKAHPVAYASRALSPQESCYAITELETLAIVWAISHFHAYLYGHDVLVYTDHSAVITVLQTPSANGKHARWWSNSFGSGLKSIQIKYRPGKDNCTGDALSRSHVSSPLENELISTTQIAVVQSEGSTDILELLAAPHLPAAIRTSQWNSQRIQNSNNYCVLFRMEHCQKATTQHVKLLPKHHFSL